MILKLVEKTLFRSVIWRNSRHFSNTHGQDPLLSRLKALVEELRGTSSHREKMLIIQKYPDTHLFLRFFSGLGPLYLTKRSLAKHEAINLSTSETPSTIEELLRSLNERKVTGHAAIAMAQQFIEKNQSSKGLIMDLIDRDLGVGMGRRLLYRALDAAPLLGPNIVEGERHIVPMQLKDRKAFPRTSKELPVALGFPLNSPSVKLESLQEPRIWWLISRKLDGIRCLVHWDRVQGVSLWTRAGHRLVHLKGVENALETLTRNVAGELSNVEAFYIDGELCAIKESFDRQALVSPPSPSPSPSPPSSSLDTLVEDFSAALSIILGTTRSQETKTKLTYFAFDLFNNTGLAPLNLSDRLKVLKRAYEPDEEIIKDRIRILGQYHTNNPTDFREFLSRVQENKWEGLVLRKDAPHRPGRTRDIIKIKDFFEAEFKVQDYRLETMSIIKDGQIMEEELLSAIKVDFGGKEVWVGSGFSQEERRRYARNPNLLKDCQVTVRYFQETKNTKDGLKSLRFPTIKAIYPGQRQV